MNKPLVYAALSTLAAGAVFAQAESVEKLPAVTVYSPRVANQSPASAYAMPVSSLSFDPRTDVQARNMAEGQADVTIRGGIFENTSFKIGALSLYDPQTGHYFAELPVAPVFLSAPELNTGLENAVNGFNANVASISYGLRPVRTAGFATVGFGENASNREEVYQGYQYQVEGFGSLGADIDIAHSDSDGPVPAGDHEFDRVNGRFQLISEAGQTDLLAAYQHKFFGWPNLYTPFNVDETENLQTVLFLLNHRKDFGAGDYVQAGVFWRRNKDDYEYNRHKPGQFNPYQHTTWVYGFSADGRSGLGLEHLALNYSAHAMFDSLNSTSLLFGPYKHRDYYKLAAVPEYTLGLADGSKLGLKAGATFDDTNKGASSVSPVFELAHVSAKPDSVYSRSYLSYTESSQVATYTALKSNPKAGLFRGNQNLGRMDTHNLELGNKLRLDAWQLGVAVFYRQDKDLVDWTYATSVPAARTANAVDVDTTGFELVASRSWKVIDLTLGYTALDKESDYKSATVDASFYALNYARHRVTAALVARLGAGFELRLDNEGRIQEDNSLRKGPSDVVISSVGLAYRPSLLPSLELNAQVDNLWDTDYQEVPSVPATPRQFSIGAMYIW